MDAVLLVYRHLVVLQAIIHVFALELTLQELMTQQILVAHAVGRDGFQPPQKIIRLRMLARDLGQ